VVAAGTIATLWLVLGACFYLLRHVEQLWEHYPLPDSPNAVIPAS
jgi:hypothetical protein